MNAAIMRSKNRDARRKLGQRVLLILCAACLFVGASVQAKYIGQSTMTADSKEGLEQAKISLTATITGREGSMGGLTVTFYVAGIQKGTAITNGSGVASLPYVIPNEASWGSETFHKYEIKASFSGNAYWPPCSGTGYLTVLQSFAIQGSVTEGSENSPWPIPDAVVRVTKGGGTVVGEAITDSSGYYQIDKLPAGSYTVTVEKESFSCFNSQSEVGVPRQADVNFFAGCRIMGDPYIVVEMPAGGQVWDVGQQRTIGWTTNRIISNVNIEISRDGGMNYELLFENVANTGLNTGHCPWTVSGPTSTHALIRVLGTSDTNALVVGVSKDEFVIFDGSPINQLLDLEELLQNEVAAGGVAPEIAPGLFAKVDAALAALMRYSRNSATTAVNQLNAFMNQVAAQTNKKITADAAAALVEKANSIIAALE